MQDLVSATPSAPIDCELLRNKWIYEYLLWHNEVDYNLYIYYVIIAMTVIHLQSLLMAACFYYEWTVDINFIQLGTLFYLLNINIHAQ